MNTNINLDKEIQTISERMKTLNAELDFHAKGFQFSSVRPKSAKELFGDNWKFMIEPYMDANEIFTFAELDRMKPVDIMLASFYSEGEVKLRKQKRVTINVTNGDTQYNGTYVVMAVDAHNLVIPFPKKGDAKGAYLNADKIESLTSKKLEFENRLNEIQKLITGKQQEQENAFEPTVSENIFEERAEVKSKSKISWVEGVLVTLAVAGIIYLFIPSKQSSVTTQLA